MLVACLTKHITSKYLATFIAILKKTKMLRRLYFHVNTEWFELKLAQKVTNRHIHMIVTKNI